MMTHIARPAIAGLIILLAGSCLLGDASEDAILLRYDPSVGFLWPASTASEDSALALEETRASVEFDGARVPLVGDACLGLDIEPDSELPLFLNEQRAGTVRILGAAALDGQACCAGNISCGSWRFAGCGFLGVCSGRAIERRWCGGKGGGYQYRCRANKNC